MSGTTPKPLDQERKRVAPFPHFSSPLLRVSVCCCCSACFKMDGEMIRERRRDEDKREFDNYSIDCLIVRRIFKNINPFLKVCKYMAQILLIFSKLLHLRVDVIV